MSTMSGKSYNGFASVILLLFLNLQTCHGTYTCYRLSEKDICFMFDASRRNFENSKQFCQNNGGFLLEIYNLDMQRLVEQFVGDVNLSFWYVWLNLVRTSSNSWVWGRSGNYLSYSNWETNNPVMYDTPNYGTWFDHTGNYQRESSPSTYNIGTYPWSESSGNYQGQGNYNNNNNAIMTTNYKWRQLRDAQLAATFCYQENKITYPPKTTTTTTTTSTTSTTTTTTSKPSTFKESQTTDPTLATTMTSSQAPPTTTNTSMKANYANSEASSVGIGVGVGLGGLVLIIVSSLLIAKFVFHKEIPLPFKSSRNRKPPPHETGTDVINGDYDHIDEKKLADNRSPYTELILSVPRDFPKNIPPNSGFQDLIQPNSDTSLSKSDYETTLAQTVGGNIYYNAN